MNNLDNVTKDNLEINPDRKITVGKTKIAAVYRLIFMMAALLNQFLVMFGLYPTNSLNENNVKLLSVALCIVAGAVGYWKNNSWTEEAKVGDIVKESLKNQDIDITDFLDILSDITRNKNEDQL